VTLAEAQPEQGDSYQIQRNNREIEFVEAHSSCRWTVFAYESFAFKLWRQSGRGASESL
jgi:hypothetical protein